MPSPKPKTLGQRGREVSTEPLLPDDQPSPQGSLRNYSGNNADDDEEAFLESDVRRGRLPRRQSMRSTDPDSGMKT